MGFPLSLKQRIAMAIKAKQQQTGGAAPSPMAAASPMAPTGAPSMPSMGSMGSAGGMAAIKPLYQQGAAMTSPKFFHLKKKLSNL